MPHWFKYFVYITFFFSATVHAAIPEVERNALIAFYKATSGDLWRDNTGWLGAPGTECQWQGVSCSEDQHIIELVLRSNDLTGQIPVEIADLSQLQKLVLSGSIKHGTRLNGTIPSEITHLSHLQELILSQNDLTGGLSQELGNLSQLKVLDLHQNQFSGKIPPELSKLSQLEKLKLSYNDLSGSIPAELGALSNLQELDLMANSLSGAIPEQLAELSQLKILQLNVNLLGGEIPVELAKLTQLTSLHLNANSLSGSIPKELGQLKKLTRLRLLGNQLTGSIPSELGQLSELLVLHLGENQLTGTIPQELNQLSKLKVLRMSNNKLTGDVSHKFDNILGLLMLSLQNNCFNFGDYEFLESLAGIKDLDLGSQSACQDTPNNEAILRTARRDDIHMPYIMLNGQAYDVVLQKYIPLMDQGTHIYWRIFETKLIETEPEQQENPSAEYDFTTGVLKFNKIHLREQVLSAELTPYTPPDYAEAGVYFKYALGH